jgi:aspartyl protease family protein
MRNIIVFACLALAIGGGFANQLARKHGQPSSAPVMAANTGTTGSSSSDGFKYRSVTLQRNGSHFDTSARINGNTLDFLVDTGASMIALRESDAARIGVRVSPADYRMLIQTANGTSRAAKVTLDRVQVSSVEVRDVDAFIVSDRQLAVNLLGMSFLSRVKFSYDKGRMVIEQ